MNGKEEGPAKPRSCGVELMDRKKRPECGSSSNKTIGGSSSDSGMLPVKSDDGG